MPVFVQLSLQYIEIGIGDIMSGLLPEVNIVFQRFRIYIQLIEM